MDGWGTGSLSILSNNSKIYFNWKNNKTTNTKPDLTSMITQLLYIGCFTSTDMRLVFAYIFDIVLIFIDIPDMLIMQDLRPANNMMVNVSLYKNMFSNFPLECRH